MSPHPAAGELRALSRRRFLKYALAGTAAAAAALGGTFAWLARSPKDALPAPDGLVALTAAEYQLFQAVAAASLPGADNGEGLLPWTALPVAANVDHLVAAIPAHVRGDVARALRLLDHAAIVSGWHGKRLVDLEVEAARAYLQRWADGNALQRAVVNLARRLVYVAYWREQATWTPIGFDGPVTVKWGLPRYGNAPLPASPANTVEAA